MNTVMEGPNGERQESQGVWLEIAPLSRLVFTDSFTEGFIPVEQSFMTGFVEFTAINNAQTKMIWGAFHKSDEDLRQHLEMGFEVGWNAAADQLNELASELVRSKSPDELVSRYSPMCPIVRTCLWFESNGEEAAKFYVSLLQNSYIEAINRPEPSGEALVVEFMLQGTPFMIVNGGPHYTLSPAVSISVLTEDQFETDQLWHKLLADGGEEGKCGWITDKFGASWQIVPRVVVELLNSDDSGLVQRVNKEMLTMSKIEIARLRPAAD